MLIHNKDLGLSNPLNAAVFWDHFYSSTGVSVSIPKIFESVNISTQVADYQNNIKSCLKLLQLYKQLSSASCVASSCKKKLPFENSFQNFETEYATKDSYKCNIVGADIDIPIRKEFLSRSILNVGSNVTTVHSSYFARNKLDYDEGEETKDPFGNNSGTKRTTVNCDS